MPLFVHVTRERNVRSIARAGLRGSRGVFCLPELPDYGRTHQWPRELKRSGQRTIVAIDFRLPAEQRVLVGLYNRPHLETTAGAAAGMILAAQDNVGYEVIVPEPIGPRAIHRVRRLSQVIGWRYSPEAKGRVPCGCPACLWRGEIRSRELRQRYLRTERYHEYQVTPYPALLAELGRLAELARHTPEDSRSIYTTCEIIGQIGHWKAGVAADLAFLLGHPCAEIVEATACALAAYRGPRVRAMLLELCGHADAEVQETAAWSLLDVAGTAALSLLAPFVGDEGVARAVAERGPTGLAAGR